MRLFEGKRLLVLGANAGADDIVQYARENGAWVSVADWQSVESCTVKQMSDEAIHVSTAELGQLCSYVEQRGINGVLAGVSEFNLLQAMKISEKCGLPFYCTPEQWNEVETKSRFRALCEQHNVPCPKTYYIGVADNVQAAIDEVIFPAVLKPVDSSASAGVHICTNKIELLTWLPDSEAESEIGEVIIEEYVSGDEFTAHYAIHGGKAKLVCMDDRYPVSLHGGVVTTIPIMRVYPGRYLDAYLKAVDGPMVSLVEDLGVTEGVMFIQGIYNPLTGRFAIFEAGLRSAGEVPNRFLREVNGTDYMNLLVDKALNADSGYDINSEDPWLGGQCCATVSFASPGGTVRRIIGVEKALKDIDSIIGCEYRYSPGNHVPNGDTLRQIVIRFVLNCRNRNALAAAVKSLNSFVDVLGDEGKSIIVKPDPNVLIA